MKAFTFLLPITCHTYLSLGQESDEQNSEQAEQSEEQPTQEEDGTIPKEDYERPFNFFTSAGGSVRYGSLYDVAISPIDYTVQFEKIFPVHTRFAMGLVWNPFPKESPSYVAKYLNLKNRVALGDVADDVGKAVRNHFAVALLVNVANLSFSSQSVDTTSPIDVGFGIGYREEKFLFLVTLELTPMRSPRSYFIDRYKDQNRTLIFANSEEPIRTISRDDDALFHSKIYPSFGIKIAYAFSNTKTVEE